MSVMDKAEFNKLSQMKYKDQAIFFCNGFWGNPIDNEHCLKIWSWIEKFIELDKLGATKLGADGNELDKFWAAKFLEDCDKAMTSVARKEALKAIDQDNNGNMSLIEYLIWKFDKGIGDTVHSPQGDNTAALAECQRKIDAVQEQMAECERKIEEQKQAIAANEEAKVKNQQAIAANEEAIVNLQKAEEDLKKAEIELQAAVDDLKRQEEEYANKCAALQAIIDGDATSFKKSKASNELAQLKQEDPLPLRRAKITQEAALRAVQKKQKATEKAKEDCKAKAEELVEAGKALEEAIKALEQAIQALEQAYADLEVKMDEAIAEMEIVKKNPTGGYGQLWFLQRELFEVDSRLPNAKQRFDHSKPFFYDPSA